MRTHKIKITSVALGLCALLGVAACEEESTDSPDKSDNTAGRVARAGSGGSGGKASAGKGGSDASDEAGKGGAGAEKAESCDGADGCYDCTPKETKQFLNHCTDSECEPFDNAERLPLLKDGKLPALP